MINQKYHSAARESSMLSAYEIIRNDPAKVIIISEPGLSTKSPLFNFVNSAIKSHINVRSPTIPISKKI